MVLVKAIVHNQIASASMTLVRLLYPKAAQPQQQQFHSGMLTELDPYHSVETSEDGITGPLAGFDWSAEYQLNPESQ